MSHNRLFSIAHKNVMGVPTISGEVTVTRVEPTVTPTFNHEHEVKVQKIQPYNVPSLGKTEPSVSEVLSVNMTSFDQETEPTIQKIKGG